MKPSLVSQLFLGKSSFHAKSTDILPEYFQDCCFLHCYEFLACSKGSEIDQPIQHTIISIIILVCQLIVCDNVCRGLTFNEIHNG